MIALLLSAALVSAVPLAFAHGHASGVRQADAELLALLEVEAKRRRIGEI